MKFPFSPSVETLIFSDNANLKLPVQIEIAKVASNQFQNCDTAEFYSKVVFGWSPQSPSVMICTKFIFKLFYGATN
jgi:hypothetical protein